MLTASATSTTETTDREFRMTETEMRFILTNLLIRQKDAQKIAFEKDYPKHIKATYSTLDIQIENLKMKLAGQL